MRVFLVFVFCFKLIVSNAQCPTSFNASATNETIYNGCNGSITIIATGGTSPFTFEYTEVGNPTNTGSVFHNGSSYTFINLCPGTYYFNVYDSFGNLCPFTGSPGNNTVTIFPAAPSLSVTCIGNNGSPACSGMSGLVEATAIGDLPPFLYNFNLTTGPTGFSPSNIQLDNFICGYITVTVMDNNGNTAFAQCPTQCSTPPMVQTVVTPSCNGSCTGTVSISISSANWDASGAPYTVEISDGVNNTTVGTFTSQSDVINVNNLCVDDYEVTLFSSVTGCASLPGLNTFSILNNSPVVINSFSKTDVDCFGNCNGEFSLNISGGTAPYSIVNYDCATLAILPSNDNLCPGMYCPQVMDVYGCYSTGSSTITITQPNELEILIDSIHHETIASSMDGELFFTVAGGTPGYSFQIDGNSVSLPINNLEAGSHTICVTDNKGCSICENFNIGIIYNCSMNLNPTIVHTDCNGSSNGSIITNVTGNNGPVTYLWSPISLVSPSISNLAEGTYCVQVIDSVGCLLDTCIMISAISNLSANVNIINADCSGNCSGQIQLTASGGIPPYSYSNFLCSGSSMSFIDLCAGDYCPVIIDSLGCSLNLGPLSITQPQPLQLNIDSLFNETFAGASDGAIYPSVTGGTGSVSLYLNGNLTNLPISSLGSGNYTICAEDANLCSTCVNFTIDTNYVCNFLFSSFTNPSACEGWCTGECGLMNMTGNGYILYQWSTGQNSSTISGLCDGNYCVSITDSIGCQLDTCFTLLTPSFSATVDSIMVSCHGNCDGSVIIHPSGGPTGNYLYSFDNSNWSSQNNFGSLCFGSNTFYYSDSICIDSISVQVTEPSPLSWFFVSVTPASTPSSSDGEIYVVGTGGTEPFIYTANGGSCFNIPAGTYNVCVTDSLGCMYCDSVSVGYLTTIDELNKNNFSIYPNPAHVKIQLVFDENYSGNILISDMIGKLIMKQNIYSEKIIQLDISNLENGVYFIHTLNQKAVFVKE